MHDHIKVIPMDKMNSMDVKGKFCSIIFMMGSPWFPRDYEINLLEKFYKQAEKYP